VAEIKAISEGIKNNFLKIYRATIWNSWLDLKNDSLMDKACIKFEKKFNKALEDKEAFFLSEHKSSRKDKRHRLIRESSLVIASVLIIYIITRFLPK
jgi:hypothetical protein